MVYSTKIMDFIRDELNNDISLFIETPYWKGDPSLKKANLQFHYTDEEIAEYTKCSTDILYFADKYCHIMTDDGIKKITLRNYQREYLKTISDNRFIVSAVSRQIGITNIAAIIATHFLLFNVDKNFAYMSQKATTSAEFIEKVKILLSNLPFYMRPGIVSYNKGSITTDTGTKLLGVSTTQNVIGYTIDFLYIDNAAYCHQLDNEWSKTIFPTISTKAKSKIVLNSTPNGYNYFYNLFNDAVKGMNNFTAIKYDYSVVPGRDEEWKKHEIENLGSESTFNREYCVHFGNERLMLPEKAKKESVDFIDLIIDLQKRISKLEDLLSIKNI